MDKKLIDYINESMSTNKIKEIITKEVKRLFSMYEKANNVDLKINSIEIKFKKGISAMNYLGSSDRDKRKVFGKRNVTLVFNSDYLKLTGGLELYLNEIIPHEIAHSIETLLGRNNTENYRSHGKSFISTAMSIGASKDGSQTKVDINKYFPKEEISNLIDGFNREKVINKLKKTKVNVYVCSNDPKKVVVFNSLSDEMKFHKLTDEQKIDIFGCVYTVDKSLSSKSKYRTIPRVVLDSDSYYLLDPITNNKITE